MPIASLFNESHTLPHIPKVVMEIIDSFKNEDIDFDTLGRKIALDQALTAKVLRLANSARFGASRTIAHPNDAVVVLGFDTLRTLVLASGMTSAFKTPPLFDHKQFWRTAFSVAAMSKWLANYTPGVDKEIVFTCGMLHSIGELLLRILKPSEMILIDEAIVLGGQQHSSEQAKLGYTSAEVGAELAKRWNFPIIMQQAILDQNNPALEKDYNTIAGLLYIAKYLLRSQQQQWPEDEILAHFPTQVAQHIQLDVDRVYVDLASTATLNSGLDALLE